MERTLQAERREGTGKGAARKIRATGHVPGVLYGRGGDPVPFTVDARDLFHTLHTDAGMNVLVELHIGKDRVLAMPRELQQDHLRGKLKHIDFIRIARDEKITVDVPIQLVGESPGVKEGGLVEHHLWSLEVEAFPQDVPSSIEADIGELRLGDGIKVSQLKLPASVTVLTDADETIVSIVQPQVLRVEEEEEAAAEEGAEGEATDSERDAEGGSGDSSGG